jgi:rare lipoprotein A
MAWLRFSLGAILFFSFFLGGGTSANAMGKRRYTEGETQTGNASWYGNSQGHVTASGERFDERDFTAAHRYLPFGSIVRVTNLENGRTVDVRINDRGPWKGGRILDVSSAAADVLDMKRAGIVRVKLELLKLGSPARHNE